MLKFSFDNRKMHELANMLGIGRKAVASFDLPAGYTCPMANLCKAYAHKMTGKITDGKDMKFRCYAASGEAMFPSVRKARWHNFDELRGKSVSEMVALIESSLPKNLKVLRIHSSGDFFSRDYFMAWMIVSENHPEITFFGYTKVLEYVDESAYSNLHLVYSHGGKQDDMVTNQPVAYVVMTEKDAVEKGLPLACKENPADDYVYVVSQQSFAIALHGTQPAK